MTIEDLKHIIHFKASLSGGAGGQNRDHRSTKVHMWVKIDELPLEPLQKRQLRQNLSHHVNHKDELWVEAQKTRSQEQNRDRALEHLLYLITEAIKEPAPRIPNEPPRSAEENRLQEKHLVSRKKQARHEGNLPHGNP
ncbi:MAG: peptide chain release factor-like protein [Patescibacteria group bacterium]